MHVGTLLCLVKGTQIARLFVNLKLLFSVHRRSGHALDASRGEVAEREVASVSIAGQQNLHLHMRRKGQATQEEGVQGSHGCRICLHNGLLAGNEVCHFPSCFNNVS